MDSTQSLVPSKVDTSLCHSSKVSGWQQIEIREFALFQTSSISFNFIEFVKCWRNFLGLNSKGPYLSLEKEQENLCVVFTYFIKRGRETSKFHIAVVQRSFAVEPRQRDAKRREKKNNLWSQELRVSFPCNIRIIYFIKPVWSWCACLFSLTLTAEIWSYVTLYDALKKNCAKAYLEKCYKNCNKFFSKKCTLQVSSIWKGQKSAEKYTLCMFLEVNRIKRISGPWHLYYCTRSN